MKVTTYRISVRPLYEGKDVDSRFESPNSGDGRFKKMFKINEIRRVSFIIGKLTLFYNSKLNNNWLSLQLILRKINLKFIVILGIIPFRGVIYQISQSYFNWYLNDIHNTAS